jgi:hypothetical protein
VGGAGFVMIASPNLLNAALFQGAWFACVLGGAAGTSAWGAGAVAGLLAFAAIRDRLRSDLAYAAVGAAVGFALDTLWIQAGVLDYAGAAVAPAWIVLLWAGVGLTLNHSMAPFALRPWLGAMLAGASAPLSYLGGERLGAVTVPEPMLLGVVAVAWMAVFGVAFRMARGTCVRDRGMTHSAA